ncbi:hypothetical protein C6Y45_14310 [Alkalicoccus saliphilus]|uniref:Uncharacterized protein n=1 Tax=Alkalicoccus saliphilus TaxID=200989 RepID=A0A2T4U3B6_9BACI|nr:hypothetical protein C6Y45_14310 [Alkalicoccus saliphilus]
MSGAVPFFMELSGVAAEFLQYPQAVCSNDKKPYYGFYYLFFKFSIYYIFYITFMLIFGESNE